MIILTRTIEYQYDTVEEMAKDVACWTLRPSTSKWFPFNSKKRARSTIASVVDTGPEPGPLCACGHPLRHHADTADNAYCLDRFTCGCDGFTSAEVTS